VDDQIGFLFRKCMQRNTAIFTERMVAELTPTQFAALARLYEVGPCSQNRLGRLTAMDGATIKGVIGRLTRREFTELRPDSKDARLLMVHLTAKGRETTERGMEQGLQISAETLRPLTRSEQATLLRLLKKIC
jgi:MarR family transcriptional regulator, lower aerobic nicotinate degradation pathway regulator